MTPAHPLYLAWIAESPDDGARRPRAPLHLTLVPPFTGDAEAVRSAVAAVAATSPPIAIRPTTRGRLGPRRDVPVLLVGPVPALRALHTRLMDALEAGGLDLGHARHVRAAFLPHITVRRPATAGAALDGGDAATADHVALLRRGDGWTEVAWRTPLSS